MSNARKRTLSFAAALICIILYLAALSYGAWRIYVNYSSRMALAEYEFDEIADLASSAAVVNGFMTRDYQDVIKDTIRDSVTLLGVIISGSNGEFGFERPNGNLIELVGNNPRFKTGFGIAKDPLFKSIWVEGQRNTTVRAIYSYIDYNVFMQVLKDTLFIILLIVAFAILVLILEINLRARDQSETAPAPIKRQARPEASPYVQDTDTDYLEEDEAPKGLYSPRGIGWESYTAERLDSELHRCAALEEDLVLIEMESRENRFDKETYKKLIIEVLRFFTQRDLIFEKGEQGITLIIPALNLEQGFAKSEEFRNKINNSLIDSYRSSTELCIGLSSRAGRLVEAERLIFEASQALVKALKDTDSPIVAFKSDPEKYRDFISKRKN